MPTCVSHAGRAWVPSLCLSVHVLLALTLGDVLLKQPCAPRSPGALHGPSACTWGRTAPLSSGRLTDSLLRGLPVSLVCPPEFRFYLFFRGLCSFASFLSSLGWHRWAAALREAPFPPSRRSGLFVSFTLCTDRRGDSQLGCHESLLSVLLNFTAVRCANVYLFFTDQPRAFQQESVV